jgi:hypothetical protein
VRKERKEKKSLRNLKLFWSETLQIRGSQSAFAYLFYHGAIFQDEPNAHVIGY